MGFTVSWSKTGASRSGTALLVLLHGYGSHEGDLFTVAEHLPEELTVVSLRAPQPVPGAGYGWFSLRAVDGERGRNHQLLYTLDEVRESTEQIALWCDGIRADHSSITLLGFSQGMSMATSLLRYRPEDFAAVVGLSGFVIEDSSEEFFQDAQLIHQRIPFFWGLDPDDPVIPEAAERSTDYWLCRHTHVRKRLYPGMGHSIGAQELADVSDFLRDVILEQGEAMGQSALKGTVFDRAETLSEGLFPDPGLES